MHRGGEGPPVGGWIVNARVLQALQLGDAKVRPRHVRLRVVAGPSSGEDVSVGQEHLVGTEERPGRPAGVVEDLVEGGRGVGDQVLVLVAAGIGAAICRRRRRPGGPGQVEEPALVVDRGVAEFEGGRVLHVLGRLEAVPVEDPVVGQDDQADRRGFADRLGATLDLLVVAVRPRFLEGLGEGTDLVGPRGVLGAGPQSRKSDDEGQRCERHGDPTSHQVPPEPEERPGSTHPQSKANRAEVRR